MNVLGVRFLSVDCFDEVLDALEQIAERRFLVEDDADERDQMVEVAKAALAKAKGGA